MNDSLSAGPPETIHLNDSSIHPRERKWNLNDFLIHELNLNDEPELIDDVISEISYDEVFEGEEARTVYEKKFKKWLSKAEHQKLAFVKKKKKKKDLFTKVQDDVPDQGDVVDKKMDWMYRKQKRLKKRKNRNLS